MAVEHERNRIARDMYDIVAHSLAVFIAQADGARYARVADPDSVERALGTIATTARDALRDVRGILAQLRHGADDIPATESHNLGTLVDRMRTAGLRIDFTGVDRPQALGASGQLTLYRIAQEALTNALRHGDSSHPVSMDLIAGAAGTTMTVRNRVRSAEGSAGHGLGVPDVVLMDIRMPVLDGIAATEEIVAASSTRPKIVVLTTFDLDESAARAIKAGASGFVLEDADPEFLLAAIRTVHAGNSVIAASATTALLNHFTEAPVAPVIPEPFTRSTSREQEIFRLAAKGMTNSEIATSEYFSEATVKTHISRIFTKRDVRDRVQLVVYGLVR